MRWVLIINQLIKWFCYLPHLLTSGFVPANLFLVRWWYIFLANEISTWESLRYWPEVKVLVCVPTAKWKTGISVLTFCSSFTNLTSCIARLWHNASCFAGVASFWLSVLFSRDHFVLFSVFLVSIKFKAWPNTTTLTRVHVFLRIEWLSVS